ncbi:hypothetical protein K2173_017575 [Erythroxylum novogranatense]|uniref:Protein kinase domain-containing protein n=1 Tax=Erythroxylum novogranatense TaxID=1862640 RepID=A0AAV8T7L6_9ROSI|nr:hypothetical protein K2173_017575 [Erythroxylum novogranatense]
MFTTSNIHLSEIWGMHNSMSCFSIKKIFESKSMKTFTINGGLLLEKLIGFCDGRSNPIRIFSEEEIKLATNNFDERVCRGAFSNLYKGVLQGRPIIVKKYRHAWDKKPDAINEIVYASGMSVHRNVLKFLGCCLEANCPLLVFETAQITTLADRIGNLDFYGFQPMPWKTRLKIAVEIAHAVVYLHTAFHRPIVHRNIMPSNVLLDEHDKAKLFDFSLCVSIPEGESHVEEATAGTYGFIAPEYMITGLVSEKCDVYSFGVFLLVLLTGQGPVTFCRTENGDEVCLIPYVESQIENNRFEEIVDPCIVAEGTWVGKEQQLKAVVCLAILCINDSEEERPTMIEVAKELRNIYRTANGPC